MRELPPVDLDWIARAPVVMKIRARFSAPPERVFAAFADAAGWPRWFPLMTAAAYCGGARGGLGAEREVKLRGLGRFRERFIAWDQPSRYAFTMIATSSPLMKRIAEDYRLTADGAGSRLDWTLGAEPVGLGKLTTPGFRLLMPRILRRAARNLERELSQN